MNELQIKGFDKYARFLKEAELECKRRVNGKWELIKVCQIDKLRIGNVYYSVEEISHKEIRKIFNDKKGNYLGACVYDEKRILISRKQSEYSKLSVLWHEVMHAIFFERNVDVNKKGNEEIIVEDSAQGLIQLIRDNPIFIELTTQIK